MTLLFKSHCRGVITQTFQEINDYQEHVQHNHVFHKSWKVFSRLKKIQTMLTRIVHPRHGLEGYSWDNNNKNK